MLICSNFKNVVSSETYETVVKRVKAFAGLVPFVEYATHWYSDMQSNPKVAEAHRLLMSHFIADFLADTPDYEGYNEVAKTCLSLLEGTPYHRFLKSYDEMYALIEEAEWVSETDHPTNQHQPWYCFG